MTLSKIPYCLFVGAIALTTALVPASAAEPPNYSKIMADNSDALVVLKFVLKRGENEADAECAAVMIEPTGLALCSGFGLTWGQGTPTDIKVLVGDDDTGVDGKLLARDSELDLAWVQVKSPPTKPYKFVDLTKSVVPVVGDSLVSIRRMAKFFDRAPAATFGQLVGIARKPRDLYVPGGGMVVDPGAPIFSGDGRHVGFVVVQFPDAEAPRYLFAREADFRTLILPAADVVRATERAKKAKDGEEMSAKAVERAKKEAEAEAEDRKSGAAPKSTASATTAPAAKPAATTRPADDEEEEEGE
jgi:hypothetical protein